MTLRLVEWFNTLPTVVLLLAALFGAGWVVLRAAGMAGLRALALAPAVSAIVHSVNGIVLPSLGRPFGWGAILQTTVVAAALAWIVRHLVDRWAPGVLRQPEWLEQSMTSRSDSGSAERRLVLTCAATWIVACVPVIATITPMAVSQSGDALYHYTQVALIERTDLASMLEPNAGMFGLTPHASFYPVVWHQIAALGAWSWQETLTANNVLLLSVPLVWYLGLAYLARTVLRRIPHAPYLALGAGMLVPVFPWRLTYDAALWPYCLAMALCPAVMAVGVECLRRARTLVALRAARTRAVTLTRAAIALSAWAPFLVGVAFIHPSALVVIAWPAAAVLWAGLVRSGVRAARTGEQRRGRVLLAAAAALAVAGVIFVVGPGPQQAHFARRPDRSWSDPHGKLLTSLNLFYGGAGPGMHVLAGVVLVLLGVSVWVCVRRRRHLELLVAWASCPPLILAALAPVPVLSALVGVFYNNPYRVEAMTAPLLIMMLVVAVDAVGGRAVPWLARRLERVGRLVPRARQLAVRALAVAGVVAALAGLGACGAATAYDVRQGYLPVRGDTRFIVDDAELAMIRRLPGVLPDSALVLGDPVAGSGYIPILTGLSSVWVFPGQSSDDADGFYLREHFNEIHDNPQVCEVLVRHGIRYFYRDVDYFFNGVWLSRLRPGLYNVDTTTGFTLIDSGGSATLWRIDTCAERS